MTVDYGILQYGIGEAPRGGFDFHSYFLVLSNIRVGRANAIIYSPKSSEIYYSACSAQIFCHSTAKEGERR